MEIKTVAGNPMRLGAYAVGNSINFAVNIPDDRQAQLVLTDQSGKEVLEKVDLPVSGRYGDVACVCVSAGSAKLFGYYYEIEGEKYIDPYARRIQDGICYVDYEKYNWAGDVSPEHRLCDLVIYKLHVRGFTMDPKSGVRDKGTFRGLMQKIPYIKALGFTAVELMPAYEWSDSLKSPADMMRPAREASLSMLRGNLNLKGIMRMNAADTSDIPEKKNYWGYSLTNYYFAPKQSFSAADDSVTEFKNLVKALHSAGIECIMEFYVAPGTSISYCLEALRNWKIAYHVDGFHIIGQGVAREAILEDPILARTKIFMDYVDDNLRPKLRRRRIAVANNSFQINARRFLKGDENIAGTFAWFMRNNPDDVGIVNYVANVDGFTLHDAVTYNEKHNEANGENNYDGSNENYSWNCGVEGPTKRKTTNDLRRKQIKNGLSYCLLAQGIPLVYAGDEFGNSQEGNNNAYCCDNPMGWVNWAGAKKFADVTEYLKELIAFRAAHPILHPNQSLRGTDYRNLGYPDISFHDTKAWYFIDDQRSRSLGILLNGGYAGEDRTYIYIGFNARWEEHSFALPSLPAGLKWERAIESASEEVPLIQEKAVRATLDRQAEAARDRAVIATARAQQAYEEEQSEREYRAYYFHQKEAENGTASEDGGEAENNAATIEKRIADRIMFGKHSASALQKSADEAWEEVERVQRLTEAPVFPEDQRYILVPARSVTVLIASAK
ncbi:MAG: alpha-amylase family glycosyl hydrolase [Lachnospiraceae bacterium]|nr:alpha-amylase family glycosyl hydrolase [Lachnospiraceae bacterium]